MEDEDFKPIIQNPDFPFGVVSSPNSISPKAEPESERFGTKWENLSKNDNHHVGNNRNLITDNLSETDLPRGAVPNPGDISPLDFSSIKDSNFQEAKDHHGNSSSFTEKDEKDTASTTTGSKRKRKNSKPINYFHYFGRRNFKNERDYQAVDDLPSDQEQFNEEVYLDRDQQVDEQFDDLDRDQHVDEQFDDDHDDDDDDAATQGLRMDYSITMNNDDEDEFKVQTIVPPEDLPYNCSKCGESFALHRDLTKHMRTHTDEQLYICSICDENFFLSENLEMHMKSHMEDAPTTRYKCCTCSRSFPDPDSLSDHLETHSKKYPILTGAQSPSPSSMKESLKLGGVSGKESFFEENMMSFKLRYPCTYCDFTFVSPSSLKTHLRTHTGEKPFQCSICQMTFSLSNNLLTHMRKHTGERPYKCTICGRGFCKSSDVTRHMRTHTGEKPHLCAVCKKGFSDVTKLKVHMRIHSKNKPYQCDICQKTFCQKSNLNLHKRKYHGHGSDDNDSPSVQPQWDDDIDRMDGEEEEEMDLDGHSSNVKDHLRMHLEKSKKDFDNGDDRIPTGGDTSPYIKYDEEDVRLEGQNDNGNDSYLNHSPLPPYSFTSGSGGAGVNAEDQRAGGTPGRGGDGLLVFKTSLLPSPMTRKLAGGKTNNDNKSVDYDLIAKSLPTTDGVGMKEPGAGGRGSGGGSGGGGKKKAEKQKIETFKCTECVKEFRSASALNIHVRTHTGERPFECSMCSWTFSILGNLKAHMKTHSGEKPYRCEVCDKAFTKKCDVKRHLITHTGERNHMCVVCGKTFSQKCVLQTHMLLHSGEKPFKCNECEKAFSQRVQLLSHVKIHKGDRPYQCTMCEKKFREKSTRETHERIHTGEMPFQCTTCGKFFRDKSYLRKHVKRYHEN